MKNDEISLLMKDLITKTNNVKVNLEYLYINEKITNNDIK